jgi:hypothetical protein
VTLGDLMRGEMPAPIYGKQRAIPARGLNES